MDRSQVPRAHRAVEAEVVWPHLAGLTMEEVGNRLGELNDDRGVPSERAREILDGARERVVEA